MSDFLLSQLLVSITLVVECFAMQQKNQNRILALMSVSCLFNGLHFFLLEQPTAGYIFLFASIRFLISIKWKSRWIVVASLLISLAITGYSYIGFLSILGFIGTVFITVGSFSPNDKALRILMIIGSAIWLVHNTILWTPVGILLEVIFVGSGVVGYYRFYGISLYQNDGTQQFDLGVSAVSSTKSGYNYGLAMEHFCRGATKGHVKAQLNLGIGYALGLGLEKDVSKAIYWFEMAATQKCDAAQYNLGRMMEHGAASNQEEAMLWYHKAANNGNVKAQVRLGLFYGSSKGVPDYHKSAHWFGLAAKQGDARAQYNLAVLQANGWGLRRNKQHAVQMLAASATQGNLRAIEALNGLSAAL